MTNIHPQGFSAGGLEEQVIASAVRPPDALCVWQCDSEWRRRHERTWSTARTNDASTVFLPPTRTYIPRVKFGTMASFILNTAILTQLVAQSLHNLQGYLKLKTRGLLSSGSITLFFYLIGKPCLV